MSELSRFKVVLDGTVLPEANREEVIRKLCELFHSRPSRMEKLLGGEEVSLKKEYSEAEATGICHAIRDAGARCKLVPLDDDRIEFLDDDSALSEYSENQVSRSIECPSCGRACDPNWQRCHHCQYWLEDEPPEDSIQIGLEDEPVASAGLPNSAASEQPEDQRSAKRPRQDEIKHFVGPNASYYLKQFSGMGSLRAPKFRLTWHWPALLVFPFWALYRKLWLWAGAYYAGSFLVVMLGGSSILMLLFTVAWPLVANYLYYRHVASKLRAVDTSLEPVQRQQILSRQGGVSKLAMWAGVGASFLFSMYLMNNLKTTLIDAYDERFGIGPDSVEVVYGDGGPLIRTGDENSPLANTVERMTSIGSALKIVIAAGNGDALDRAVDGLAAKARSNEVLDAWANPMSISRDSGVIIIRSAGRDGQSGNADDLVYRLPFNREAAVLEVK